MDGKSVLYINACVYVYIYIYMDGSVCWHGVYIYIYIYVCVYVECVHVYGVFA